jgi:hypothetical protein
MRSWEWLEAHRNQTETRQRGDRGRAVLGRVAALEAYRVSKRAIAGDTRKIDTAGGNGFRSPSTQDFPVLV